MRRNATAMKARAGSDTEVRQEDTKLAWAIYGGHISGRRLRGIKINPIYHESDAASLRSGGAGGDGQPEGAEPVGEIQFEVYESIPPPAHRLRRQKRPEQSYRENSSYDSDEDEGDFRDDEDEEEEERERLDSFAARRGPERKQHLKRQERVGAVSSLDEDPPDYLEPVTDQLTPATSGYSSPSTSSRPSPKAERTNHGKKSSSHTDHPLPLRRHRQLSAVQEQSSFVEDEEDEEALEDSGNLSSDDLYDGVFSPDANNSDKFRHVEVRDPELGEETCHIVSFTSGKETYNDELFSCEESDKNMINSFMNKKNEFSIDTNFTSSLSLDDKNEDPALLSSKNKAFCSLDKIAMLPSYSNIHHTSPVTSVDYINNNYGTVPDRMLKQNGPLKEVDEYFKLIHKKWPSKDESGEGAEEQLQGESIEKSHSIKSFIVKDNRQTCTQKDDNSETSKCPCKGRPTLKCPCGRSALQRLLYEKHMTKGYEVGYHLDCSIVKWSPAENTPDSTRKNCERPPEAKNKQVSCRKVKSILIRRETDEKCSSQNYKIKMVTFSEDTIFNEGKKSTYVKETITPGFLSALIDSLDDGIDNPVFEDDPDDAEGSKVAETSFSVEDEKTEGSLTDDEKFRRKCSFKHPSAKNRVTSTSPITLQVSDLNACSYMQSYLNGLQRKGCDIVRIPGSPESSSSISTVHRARAPPVSIEAIGGTTTLDPSFEEIGEAEDDDLEYYRRRRRRKHLDKYGGDDVGVEEWLKKAKRIKRIKITAIVIGVIAVIVVTIALLIHFLGTSDTSGTEATSVLGPSLNLAPNEASDDLHRLSAGVLLRKR